MRARLWLVARPPPRRALSVPRARLDYRALVGDVDAAQRNVEARRSPGNPVETARLHALHVRLQTKVRATREARNAAAAARDHGAGKELKKRLAEEESEARGVEKALEESALALPNWTFDGAPSAEEGPRLLREVGGGAGPAAGTPVRDHAEVGERLGLFDLDAGARVSGHGFAYMTGDGALLEMALVSAAVQRLAARGFRPVLPPDLVRPEVSAGCGFRPRGGDDQTYALERDGLALAATAEVPLAGMFGCGAPPLDAGSLPARAVAFGHAFRREAGSHGAATRGVYRLHQFSKAEMFAVCAPEQCERVFDELVAEQQAFFEELGLRFRVLEMPADDLGAPAFRKVDMEAWLPARGAYGEISSASRCTDYQARRLGIRYRDADTGKPRFAHTLNATACAVPRTVAAILEQHQQPDGSVALPEILRPWFGGRDRIG